MDNLEEHKHGMERFLNPRSMLTPGVAGSVVMVIANTMWIEFMIPQKWTALVLSFLIIIPILMQFGVSLIENIIYFMFNGLIIFALSVNTNFAGRKLQDIVSRDQKVSVSEVVTSPKALAAEMVFFLARDRLKDTPCNWQPMINRAPQQMQTKMAKTKSLQRISQKIKKEESFLIRGFRLRLRWWRISYSLREAIKMF